ncbi:MAG: class I SAM-dependent methyltransferase [Ardenticatenaceae bacterium]|nr:class I SAM-dependent methyltransferase [Ardenticatenaceae bacterium]MCB8986411.1 class I SAM-dependent methyltransferase [Ardenticatenaceae bacterium]
MANSYSPQAALRGEPGYVWRSGQERRLAMIRRWVDLDNAVILDNGCGLGTYLEAFAAYSPHRFGLELEHDRALQAVPTAVGIVEGLGETLPFADESFDFVFSNEVIEHVADDAAYAAEMVRVVRENGRILLFCPNRWYPVEQHGIYWRGAYKFGNIPLVNYLPDVWRNKLAPHVRTYTKGRLLRLFADLPVAVVYHGRIFGGYDNIEYRLPRLGKTLKKTLYAAEKTPLSVLGLSHLLVLQKRG